MKKLLLIAILLFAFLSNSKASHVSSADLTYECLGGLSYKFTLKIYRDCSGQSVSNSQVISYSAPSCGLSSGFIMNVDTSYEISQVCDSLLPYTNCNSGSIQGIEVYVYTKTVSLLAYCSDYNFSIAICCRSTALSNLSTTGFNFYTSTTLNNLGGRCNDSPIFKAVPILYTCFSEVVNFNNLAFDVEGDSLSYKLVRTVGGNGINIPYSHVSLSATNPFFTASGILFDSVSGQMSFTSNLIQQVMATVLITEYDTNGNVKGTHMRDLHFIIINCPPPKHNPYTTGVNFDTTNYTYFGCYNEPLFFDVYSVSFDSASPIDLQYFSSIPGATFTTRVSNDTTFGKFSWNPGNRLGDYYFSIQTVAKTCPLKRQNIFNYRINLDTFLHECIDTTIFLPLNGSLTIDSTYVLDVNTSGVCNTDRVLLSKSNFSCNDTGQNIVNVTTYYSNGIIKTCSAIVTVVDSVSPYAACVDTTIYLNSKGEFTIDSTFIHDTTIISCGTISMILDKYKFNCSDLGVNIVSLEVTEGAGLKDTCQAMVTVLDTTKPNPVCKNINVYLDSLGQISIDSASLDNGSTDNCSVASFALSVSDFDCDDIGVNKVWMIVTDISGNKDSCQGMVSVFDTLNPIPYCMDTTIYLNSFGVFTITNSFVNNRVTDNCVVDSIWLSKYNFDCTNIGNDTIRLYVKDGVGNSDSCTAVIHVIDTQSPTAICQNISVYLNQFGTSIIDSSDINNGSFDNCNIRTIRLSDTLFDCSDIGLNMITMTVTDSYGNTGVCQATVTVIDTVRPMAICSDTTVYIDSLGIAIINSNYIDNLSSDNCGIDSIWLSQYNFDCMDAGANSISLYVLDSSGNIDSCSSIVTIIDTVNPIANCNDTTIYLSASGTVTIDSSFIHDNTNVGCDIYTIKLDQYNYDCGNIGSNTITMTATDINGNQNSCQSIVTVLDTTKPVAICQNITVYLNALGSVKIDSSDIDNGSTDNCKLHTIKPSDTLFTCSNQGINLITMVVSDSSGNQDSCQATVTVLDTVRPMAICTDTTVYIDSTGLVTITTNFVDNGSTDNCRVDSMWLSKYTFDCHDTGKDTISFYVVDSVGNIDSCHSIITIVDTVNPIASCSDTTIYLSASGTATIDSSFINSNLNYGCDIFTIKLNQYNYDCSNIGLNSISMTVTDINGNQDSCQSIVTVLDTTKPNAICQNITIYLNALGWVKIDSSDVDNGSNDNCDIRTIKISDTLFDCSNQGINVVTIIVTDFSGNTDSCQANVTVLDAMRPAALCKDTVLFLNSVGSAVITSTYIDNGSYDNCSLDSLWLSKDTFDCQDTGRNTVTLYVIDSAGNIDSCSAVVTINDTNRPTAICIDTAIYLNGSGSFVIDSSFVNNNSSFVCDISTIKLSQYSFNCSHIGANLVSMYVTDINGNQDSCQAIVTVFDTLKPTARCKNSTVYLNSLGTVSINNTYTNYGTIDNCLISSITLSDTSFDCRKIGANIVTMVVTDNYGNVDSCQSVITVLDTIRPQAFCKDTSIYLDTSGIFVISSNFIDNGSYDNCKLDSIWLSNSAFDCSNLGGNVVQLFVKDSAGNIDSCQANVTVFDTNSAVARCLDTTIYINGSVAFTIDSTFVNGNINSGCDVAGIKLSKYVFDCQDLGANVVKMVITDLNGNMDSCQALVTVLDTNNPVANCRNITVYLNSSGTVSIDSSDIDNGSTYSCGLASMTLSKSNFDCSNKGPNNITLTVTDIAGKSDSCQSIVTVIDAISPTPICRDTSIYINSFGSVTITNSFIDNGSYDNCGVDSVWLSRYTFDCFNVGANPVKLYVIDSSGNIDSCAAMVTVNDTTKPVVACKDTTVYLSVSGTVSIDSSYVNNSPSSGCDIETIKLNQYNFNCSHIGVNPVTMTVTDINGNMDSCSANVIVLDTTKPIINCNNINVYLDATGSVSIDSSDIDNGSYDNCSILTLKISQSMFNCSQVGNNTVNLIGTDQSGNIDSCQSIVVVSDTIKPSVICKDTSIYLNNAGQFVISNNFIDNGTFDNCGIDSLWLSQYSFDCSHVGNNSVSLYALDSNGNLDSCSAMINVIDTIDANTNAGLDTNICGYGTIQLNGSQIPVNQTATWTTLSGPSAVTITNGITSNPTMSGMSKGSYNFLYSITKGLGCIIDSDTIQVNILDTLFALAGPDIHICNQTNTNLMATATPYGILGYWSHLAGSPNVPTIFDTIDPTTNVSNLQDGIYTFLWTVSNGLCIDVYDTSQITVSALPVSNAGVDQNLCGIYSTIMAGNALTGRATGNWRSISGPNVPILTNPLSPTTSVSGLVEGIYCYVWEVNNGNCLPAYDTMFINVYDPPVSFAGNDTILCGIDSLNMFALPPVGTSQGVWSMISALPLAVGDTNSPVSKVSSMGYATTHTFEWTVSNGTCPAEIDTVEIQVLDQPIADAGPDSSYCDVVVVSLSATPLIAPSIGNWYLDLSSSPPNIPTFSDTSSPSTFVSGLIEGTYRFIWRAQNSPCYEVTDTVEITIFNQHFAKAGPDQSFCDKNSTVVSANVVGGSATSQWLMSASSPNSPRYNPALPYQAIDSLVDGGEYFMIWEISNGVCPVSRDTVVIFNHHRPNSNFGFDKDEICQGDSVNFFSLSTIPLPDSIIAERWDILNSQTFGANTTKVFNLPGYFGVELITTSKFGCEDTVKLDDVIFVHENPIANFSIDYIPNTPRVDINDMSTNAYNYIYKFDDGGVLNIPNPHYIYRESGFYTIWQIVTNDFGCIDSISKLVQIEMVNAFVPSAFTPDNDGINDVFVPVISEGENPNYKFSVFNRWGELIFESTEIGKGWDGTYKGTKSQTGVYVWKIIANSGENRAPVTSQGHVNLIR